MAAPYSGTRPESASPGRAGVLGRLLERLGVRSLRPVEAVLELAAERNPGVLVFGPDCSRIKGRLYRKAAKAIRERAAWLVWLA
jgi:hypothetical protein